MKKYGSFAALILTASAANTLSAQTLDFRKANWGMTSAQVMATESSKPSQTTERGGEAVLRYDSVRLAGLECRLVYIFARDKLVRAKYVFQADHSDQNQFLLDFAAVDPVLEDKYGKPIVDRVIWQNDLYKADPQSYGLAVSVGHLKYLTQWKGPRTFVSHALTGDNHDITHEIEYVSVELEAFEDQVIQQQTKDLI